MHQYNNLKLMLILKEICRQISKNHLDETGKNMKIRGKNKIKSR